MARATEARCDSHGGGGDVERRTVAVEQKGAVAEPNEARKTYTAAR